jgi:hypothetical protein
MNAVTALDWVYQLVVGAILLLLVVWAIGTAIRVHKPTRTKMKQYLGESGMLLVPSYRFFAPEPGKYDFHLLYRERLDDDTVTDWQHCNDLTDLPTRLHWIWNPKMYDTKAMFDYAQSLYDALKDEKDDQESDEDVPESPHLEEIDMNDYVLSAPYISLLSYVTGASDDPSAEQVQFLIVRGSLRDEDSEPFFLSYFHDLEK